MSTKYIRQLKDEDIIGFINDHMTENFSITDPSKLTTKKMMFKLKNKSQIYSSSFAIEDLSLDVIYYISDFSCVYNILSTNEKKDISQQWATFVRKRVPDSIQYAEDYNKILDQAIKELERKYLIERLNLTSKKIPSLTYEPRYNSEDKENQLLDDD